MKVNSQPRPSISARTFCTLAMVMALCLGHGQSSSRAQEPEMKQATKAASDTTETSVEAVDPAQPKKLTGRLPRYFSSVVDQQQRLEIYQIQAEYRAKIAEVEKQLMALRSEQLEEIENVLSATQRKQLNTIRTQAMSRSRSKNPTTISDESSNSANASKKADGTS